MDKTVSIIIPVYKVEDYISRCIESVIKQTYKNLEIILIDDGSPDRSGEICDSYAELDRRIVVIHKRNGGVSSARNAGLDVAKGEIISFLDSDDWIHKEYVERLLGLMESREADISMCDFIRTSSQSVRTELGPEDIVEYSNTEALGQFLDKKYVQMVVLWGKLYRRELFDGLRFPVGRVHEDEYLTYRLVFRAGKIAYTSLKMLYYWERPDSIMGVGFRLNHKIDEIDALIQRAEFLSSNNLKRLSDGTYRQLFYSYVSAFRKLDKNGEQFPKEYIEKFLELEKKLDRGEYRLRFKLFYKLYYRMPRLSDLGYRIYRRIKIFAGGEG